MSVIPGAGNFLVLFTGQVSNDSKSNIIISIYSNGSKIIHTEMESTSSFGGEINSLGTNAYITNLLAGQTIEIKWHTDSNTASISNRTLIVQKVN